MRTCVCVYTCVHTRVSIETFSTHWYELWVFWNKNIDKKTFYLHFVALKKHSSPRTWEWGKQDCFCSIKLVKPTHFVWLAIYENQPRICNHVSLHLRLYSKWLENFSEIQESSLISNNLINCIPPNHLYIWGKLVNSYLSYWMLSWHWIYKYFLISRHYHT